MPWQCVQTGPCSVQHSSASVGIWGQAVQSAPAVSGHRLVKLSSRDQMAPRKKARAQQDGQQRRPATRGQALKQAR